MAIEGAPEASDSVSTGTHSERERTEGVSIGIDGGRQRAGGRSIAIESERTDDSTVQASVADSSSSSSRASRVCVARVLLLQIKWIR